MRKDILTNTPLHAVLRLLALFFIAGCGLVFFLSVQGCNSVHDLHMEGAHSSGSGVEETSLPLRSSQEIALKCNVGAGGKYCVVPVTEHMEVGELIKKVKSEILKQCEEQATYIDCNRGWSMVGKPGEKGYDEDSNELLSNILDLNPDSQGAEVAIMVNSNLKEAKRIATKEGLCLDEIVWKKLGEDMKIDLDKIPDISNAMLKEIQILERTGRSPILMLDLGRSIQELELMVTNLRNSSGGNITLFNKTELPGILGYGILCNESIYREQTEEYRWLVVPGSDYGVLPGSRVVYDIIHGESDSISWISAGINKMFSYSRQLEHMNLNYQGYSVGGARELVTLYLLYLLNRSDSQDRPHLFPADPVIYGRTANHYRIRGTEFWDGRIVLGRVDAPGLLFVTSGNDYIIFNEDELGVEDIAKCFGLFAYYVDNP